MTDFNYDKFELILFDLCACVHRKNKFLVAVAYLFSDCGDDRDS